VETCGENAVIGPIVPSPPEDVFEDEYRPDYATSPGGVAAPGVQISKSELVRRGGLTEKHIGTIARPEGKFGITPETAIKLERALGMPADYWLNLEIRC